ncbi:hypothetical protein [Micromonospora sp. HNM0581]|uniref:hypothetical protein n=1 Tax=Micromonospora sp. HNM0581 TaxID=2716341 RepID=UPI001F0D5DC7|nr:hypothetical protein [Micromonospora sp. HNM0581]
MLSQVNGLSRHFTEDTLRAYLLGRAVRADSGRSAGPAPPGVHARRLQARAGYGRAPLDAPAPWVSVRQRCWSTA